MPDSEQPIIKLEHVNFWYDRGKSYQSQAIKDINLEIKRGEYVAFFGPSGSGKTTLLYLLSGVEQSQDGKILINGKDISKFSRQELAVYRQIGVGMIFQQFNLIPTLSVLNNVALPMAFLGISQGKRQDEAKKILARLAIDHLAERFPHELSGGQQQRVGIARALANNAPIIIADEPLGNLDSENSKRVLEFLKELHQKDGRTIIMVTHEAWSLRDVQKIFYIKDGNLIKTEATNPKTLAESVSKTLFKDIAEMGGGEKEAGQGSDRVAQYLASLLLRGYTLQEYKRLEESINNRLTQKISEKEFIEILDKSYSEGGVGLWGSKAKQISSHVEDIIAERKSLAAVYKHLEENPSTPPVHEVIKIRNWLLEDFKERLNPVQTTRLDEILQERLKKIITTDNFVKILNTPMTQYGLGLSMHTSQHLTDKLELALGQQ